VSIAVADISGAKMAKAAVMPWLFVAIYA